MPGMNILGIETSCDETAAAVVADGRTILSNVVASQIDIHAQYGGVVPEVAARSHIEAMLPTVEAALDQAKLGWDKIDGIAVTSGPGLLGSLLIGTLTARTLALIKQKPLYAINHVEAHVYANWLVDRDSQMANSHSDFPPAGGSKSGFRIESGMTGEKEPRFPVLALVVSGGHSQIVLFRDHLDYEVLGQTRDDAAGEAFDKIAKLLDLGFPGGPALAKSAETGNPDAFAFPKAKLGKENLDYSFSGLKTAVLRTVQDLAGLDFTAPSWDLHDKLTDSQKRDIAASFQKTVVDTLVDRIMVAYERYQPQSVVIAGGVAANLALREGLKTRLPIEINYSPAHLCTDNAAMIAALGYHRAQAGRAVNPHALQADSSLAM